MLHHKVMHHEGRDCTVGAHKWFFIRVGLFVIKVKECVLSYPPVQAASDPAVWSLFSCRIPLSPSVLCLCCGVK